MSSQPTCQANETMPCKPATRFAARYIETLALWHPQYIQHIVHLQPLGVGGSFGLPNDAAVVLKPAAAPICEAVEAKRHPLLGRRLAGKAPRRNIETSSDFHHVCVHGAAEGSPACCGRLTDQPTSCSAGRIATSSVVRSCNFPNSTIAIDGRCCRLPDAHRAAGGGQRGVSSQS